ncbi:MAG: FAD-dependent oxidoreductase, partial [Rhodothermales bacterium]|nr:FAD-dependent oxidoreductase [Rhodothermales bacterium]
SDSRFEAAQIHPRKTLTTLTISTESPLRVAIVGAGPAGFYAAEHLLKQEEIPTTVDLFDRLPTPHGLVRAGVAPDHEKIRNVTRKFEATADRPGFRYFGNVDIGKHLSVEDLKEHYHMILFTTGAQIDKKLGVEGEDLPGCHPATEFVAWYNGHPDFADLQFDLSQESVAVIGVGNVAVDVARILCRTKEELSRTDIADYALDALSKSNVRTVYMLGRRGPAQAAFTNPEIRELGEMEGATTHISARDMELDPLSVASLQANPDRLTEKKLEIMSQMTSESGDKEKKLYVRFLVSPTRFIADENGQLSAVELVRNTLVEGRGGRLSARPTDEHETLEVGLAFKSVGYRGVPIPGVPFNESWGVIANEDGRIVDDAGKALLGLYAAGWIKRGATGVIGTNKACAADTVERMLADAREGVHLQPPSPDVSSVDRLVRERQPEFFTFENWRVLDAIEKERGEGLGRPRLKVTSVRDMVDLILK